MTWPPPSDSPGDDEARRVPPWMISFVDLVSLLLSFTILVFAFGRLDGEAWSAAAHSIRTTFGGPSWMTPDSSLRPTMEAAPALPALDLGYLAQVVETRLGGQPGAIRTRLEGNRLRIALLLDATPEDRRHGGDGSPPPLRQLGEVLGRVGNALTVDVQVPAAAEADGAPGASQWQTALTQATGAADTLIEAGVAPMRIAVFATAAHSPAPIVSRSPIEIVVLDHGGRP